ncbi:glycoside hydrolase superfamily [Aspergillus avenaceus]|uniref:Glycoside hydrolase superfamily n=1 Tax=Aspergillus avenaceus TaxID=36643 RepID=A0A5N6TDX8_ASPAV|nr:glycoside hydrolase superfamily [Aspergillus avenaceus]
MASLINLLVIGSMALGWSEITLASPHNASPRPSYSSFTYTQVTSNVYATPLSTSVSFATPFAPDPTQATSLLPSGITYTTYSSDPSATATADGQYGQSAYVALWENYSFASTPPFTTTVSATPVATSELVLPPALYNSVPDTGLKLPSDFIWGISSSSWQIEGALQLEGRGPSVLDSIGNQLSTEAPDRSDANVANMHYFLYEQDIARLAAAGIPYYSFSLSWSRILPFGVAGSPVNTQGLDHYDDLINTCLRYGVIPIVTLLHVDMPTAVQADLDALPEHFLYYAKIAMTRFADRVPYWVTFNEPNIGVGTMLQKYDDLTQVLLAHADVYTWYKHTLNGTGQITVKFANNLAVPLDVQKNTHVAAAHRYQDILLGIMSNPLFLGTQYPDAALTTANLMTPLTDDQLKRINGTVDFWSFDPYTAQYASPPPQGTEACAANTSDPLWPTCVTLSNIQANGWLMGQASNAYAYLAPQYVRQQLGYIWNTFRPPGILIAEFGFNPFLEANRTLDAQRYDLERTLYYQGFLTETLKSIHEDGVRVIGALAWSLADNNEFGSYAEQYGLQTVNRTDGIFTRTYKRSLFDYIDFFRRHIT